MDKRSYKARLDLYYKLIIIYFIFLIVYFIISGRLYSSEFTIVINDPILYITFFFIVYTFILLVINSIKGKEIEFTDDRIILKNRFGQREIKYDEIIYLKFSKEKERLSNNKSEIKRIKIKLVNRKRLLRIRLSEFYDEKKLINEFKSILRYIKKN